MNWFRFGILVLCLAVLQAGIMGLFAIGSIKPNILIIAMVFFAIYANTNEAIICSFVLGFTADIIQTAAPMGPQILSFTIIGSLLAQMNRYIAIRKMPFQSLTILIIGILVGYCSYLLNLFKDQPPVPGLFGYLFLSSLYSAVVGPFLFLPLSWMMRIKLNRFSRIRRP